MFKVLVKIFKNICEIIFLLNQLLSGSKCHAQQKIAFLGVSMYSYVRTVKLVECVREKCVSAPLKW